MMLANSLYLNFAIPVIGACLIALLHQHRRAFELVFIGTAAALLWNTLRLFDLGQAAYFTNISPFSLIDSIPLAFHLEPLGLLFSGIASSLFLVTTLYAIGYMNANNEKHLARFYFCFCIAIFAVMGIAFAANLLTLFIFYEILSFSTYPLVTHKGNEAARNGGRAYLGLLLSTSIGFFLIAILWVWGSTGELDFVRDGFLQEQMPKEALIVLYTLFAFGVGKAGLMPFHRWLPSAMVAPTPVSALLHAVAVVKAGVFCVLKITVYVFGIDLLSSSGASTLIIWVATATMLLASLVALTQDNLKARLAYSTVSQLSYIVLGAALATASSIAGASMHMATHAVGKITLFFCAGAIYTAAKKTKVSELDGLAKAMPITFIAYTIAALSIIGLPPMAGSWSKWFLLDGALQAEYFWVAIAFIISTLLNMAYLLPVVARGFFAPAKDTISGIQEAPWMCLLPLSITAISCFVLFFLLQELHLFLQPLFN
ncbi:MAG: monovalent cation/H+ antiporter subunit D family protein [Proteobacteria bacterium]|jgi:multicomponent Na+:H+ antiporter subunit D|nr:monovalent cation/H+ antiporter subunit D family protein [Pseudomonadota bacterium]